ncbi:MAG: septum formation initiator family protein [Oscillospiraceae bacterium]|nr:septum formation initiator family protein [Oscillospiraceae bacterium]
MRKRKESILHNIFFDKRKRMLAVSFVILFIVVAVGWMQSRADLVKARQVLDERNQQLTEARMAHDELMALVDDEDEYIERKARDELDMVLPGERVFIIKNGG